MASIFTYETEPAKLISPWLDARQLVTGRTGSSKDTKDQGPKHLAHLAMPIAAALDDLEVSRLPAEPQIGPIEYKLHLLLRPRRTFTATSTVQKIPGSFSPKPRVQNSNLPVPSVNTSLSGASSPAQAPSQHSRQNRLQHLTTQLLWRLQQSSPHHTSSKSELVLPILPEADVALSYAAKPRRVLSGLEESLGALYEIGVSDDGTLIGLALDELEESLNVLRAMAFSLGCHVRVVRLVLVGHCQWEESSVHKGVQTRSTLQDRLWVVEALITPNVPGIVELPPAEQIQGLSLKNTDSRDRHNASGDNHAQLRVSLTGSTAAGKSTLLGTLSTSTLDNGRGKSRVSLLKHRHEVVSGLTSSLAQELIGYRKMVEDEASVAGSVKIINYGSEDVTSWADIHGAAGSDRLVFLTDSAGHPKFRRTALRSLLSWAPHWTLCCVAADEGDSNSSQGDGAANRSDGLPPEEDMELALAHLQLCLRLDLALIVVITKLDLASKSGLRQTLAKVLSMLKEAGRKPLLLPASQSVPAMLENQQIPQQDATCIQKILSPVSGRDVHLVAPIVLTSAVTGTGIGQIHAILQHMPKPLIPSEGLSNQADPRSGPRQPCSVFHIDDVFDVKKTTKGYLGKSPKDSPRLILSGYVRRGSVHTGSTMLLGPLARISFSAQSFEEQVPRSRSLPGLSKSLPKDLAAYARVSRDITLDPTMSRSKLQTSNQSSVGWALVHIVSIRYLRLPVRTLGPDQAGTIAISSSANLFDAGNEDLVRRGMVLLEASSPFSSIKPTPAFSLLTAIFDDSSLYVNPGSSVTIYTASIRAAAKIVAVCIPDKDATEMTGQSDLDASDAHHTVANRRRSSGGVFAFDEQKSSSHPPPPSTENGHRTLNEEASTDDLDSLLSTTPDKIEITFELARSVEWVEVGTKLFVMPASGISMMNPPAPAGSPPEETSPASLPHTRPFSASSERDGEASRRRHSAQRHTTSIAAGLDGFVGRIVRAE